MAINVEYHWQTTTETFFYDGTTFIAQRRDNDFISETVKRDTEIMNKHNFSEAHICSAETGELLVQLTTTDEPSSKKPTVSADDINRAIDLIKQVRNSADINKILTEHEWYIVTNCMYRIAANI